MNATAASMIAISSAYGTLGEIELSFLIFTVTAVFFFCVLLKQQHVLLNGCMHMPKLSQGCMLLRSNSSKLLPETAHLVSYTLNKEFLPLRL